MKPKNEDAEVIEVDVGGEKKKIVMAPGRVTMVFQTAFWTCMSRIRALPSHEKSTFFSCLFFVN